MIFNYNKIKKNNSPYIIAEIGVNHECSIKKAKNLILLAKKGGAHAAKFQTYKAVTLAKLNSQAYWDTTKEKTKSQFELFSKFDRFNEKDYRILAKFCKNRHEIVYNFLLSIGVKPESALTDAEGLEHHVSIETLEAFKNHIKNNI